MSTTLNVVLRGFYLDSVALMRLSAALRALSGVEDAAVMVATPSNVDLLHQADLLTENGRGATPNDAIIAVRGTDDAALANATEFARSELETARSNRGSDVLAPLALGGTLREHPALNLALISVPGEYAALEAHRALEADLDVMLFSDQVPLTEEVALKERACSQGRIVMGPDCGTALLHGLPLGFANAVPSGPVGIVAASGTGLQEVSVLLAREGLGTSHGIGVGGRDLSEPVGGLSTHAALDLLAQDPDTEHVVVISKPPELATARDVLAHLARLPQPTIACFLGLEALNDAPGPWVNTLEAAASEVLKNAGRPGIADAGMPDLFGVRQGGSDIVGLYSGGTLCAEAQTVLRNRGLTFSSNVPIPGVAAAGLSGAGHRLVDLGADEFTLGRPHPMLEPQVRADVFAEVLEDQDIGVILLDVVLGYGSHPDPIDALLRVLGDAQSKRPILIANVCGTERDPQGYTHCIERLREAGVAVAPSAAGAARWAAAAIGHYGE